MNHADNGLQSLSLAAFWCDIGVRRTLMTDPGAILRRLGVILPKDTKVKALGSRGAPSDGAHTLLQIVLERGPRFTFFFLPSPLHPSAQQAAYGRCVGDSVDDLVFEQRMRADVAAALRELGVERSDAGIAPTVRSQTAA